MSNAIQAGKPYLKASKAVLDHLSGYRPRKQHFLTARNGMLVVDAEHIDDEAVQAQITGKLSNYSEVLFK